MRKGFLLDADEMEGGFRRLGDLSLREEEERSFRADARAFWAPAVTDLERDFTVAFLRLLHSRK